MLPNLPTTMLGIFLEVFRRKKNESETNILFSNRRRNQSWKKQHQQFSYQQPTYPMQFAQQPYVATVAPTYQQVAIPPYPGSSFVPTNVFHSSLSTTKAPCSSKPQCTNQLEP